MDKSVGIELSETKASDSKNVYVLFPHSKALQVLFGVIRRDDITAKEFVAYADRLMRILAEEGLAALSMALPSWEIKTPTGAKLVVPKPIDPTEICAVSILRSGDILLEAVRSVCPGVSVGKILIQRDESDPEKRPKLYYSKFPKDIVKKQVLLCDPMLATGGSVIMAIEVLQKAGVSVKNILFLNTISCPEGVARVTARFPDLRIITGVIDSNLNHDKFIMPGLGDFGDRYYSTLESIKVKL